MPASGACRIGAHATRMRLGVELHVAGGSNFGTAVAPANPDPLAGGTSAIRRRAFNQVFTWSATRCRSFPELLPGNTPCGVTAGLERGHFCPRAVTISRDVLLLAYWRVHLTRSSRGRRNSEHCNHHCIESSGTGACRGKRAAGCVVPRTSASGRKHATSHG